MLLPTLEEIKYYEALKKHNSEVLRYHDELKKQCGDLICEREQVIFNYKELKKQHELDKAVIKSLQKENLALKEEQESNKYSQEVFEEVKSTNKELKKQHELDKAVISSFYSWKTQAILSIERLQNENADLKDTIEKIKFDNKLLSTDAINVDHTISFVNKLQDEIGALKLEMKRVRTVRLYAQEMHLEAVKETEDLRKVIKQLKEEIAESKENYDKLKQNKEHNDSINSQVYKNEQDKYKQSQKERMALDEENTSLRNKINYLVFKERTDERNKEKESLKLEVDRLKKEIEELKTTKPKNKEFKIGDRVMVRPINNSLGHFEPFKGTVHSVNDKNILLTINGDNGWLGNFEKSQCTKLVKKKPRFKVGDRVIVRHWAWTPFKGTIIEDWQSNHFLVRPDGISDKPYVAYHWTEATKLRKVRSKCDHFFIEGADDKGELYCRKCLCTKMKQPERCDHVFVTVDSVSLSHCIKCKLETGNYTIGETGGF